MSSSYPAGGTLLAYFSAEAERLAELCHRMAVWDGLAGITSDVLLVHLDPPSLNRSRATIPRLVPFHPLCRDSLMRVPQRATDSRIWPAALLQPKGRFSSRFRKARDVRVELTDRAVGAAPQLAGGEIGE